VVTLVGVLVAFDIPVCVGLKLIIGMRAFCGVAAAAGAAGGKIMDIILAHIVSNLLFTEIFVAYGAVGIPDPGTGLKMIRFVDVFIFNIDEVYIAYELVFGMLTGVLAVAIDAEAVTEIVLFQIVIHICLFVRQLHAAVFAGGIFDERADAVMVGGIIVLIGIGFHIIRRSDRCLGMLTGVFGAAVYADAVRAEVVLFFFHYIFYGSAVVQNVIAEIAEDIRFESV